jgi:D-alanine--poly(phosphoribitol) ligase subunit 1
MNSAIMMLEETVKKFGGKTAVSDEHGSISFYDLRMSAISAASGLLRSDEGETGLKPVIVYLPKSVESIVCFAGAMYSGNPYVPVDSAIPMKRLQSIIDNMKSGHIITNGELRDHLDELDLRGVKLHLYDELVASAADEGRVMDKVAAVIDSDPIYIMYTSGSTGVPKGVTIPHRGIIDYAEWLKSTFDFDEHTVLGNQSAFYFDNSTLDIFTMLYTGATMVLIPEVLFRFPAKIPDFLVDQSINTIFWVPTVMISVANSGILETVNMPQLKKVLFCGEAMPNRQLNIWRKYQPDKLYANLYGPTEITDVCTYYIVDRAFNDADPLPIGRACRNMRAIVLTEDNRQAETDETGELCILGSALARGYWNAPEITRKAFVQNPLCAEYDDRMYRTGDLAYVNSEGLIIFIGRADSQIKLRGNRIELGEIETAVKSIKEIGNACVIFDSDKEEIVLFAETECELQLRKLNMELKKIIPSYMLPGRLVCMRALPQTPNGKIDRVLLKSTL